MAALTGGEPAARLASHPGEAAGEVHDRTGCSDARGDARADDRVERGARARRDVGAECELRRAALSALGASDDEHPRAARCDRADEDLRPGGRQRERRTHGGARPRIEEAQTVRPRGHEHARREHQAADLAARGVEPGIDRTGRREPDDALRPRDEEAAARVADGSRQGPGCARGLGESRAARRGDDDGAQARERRGGREGKQQETQRDGGGEPHAGQDLTRL